MVEKKATLVRGIGNRNFLLLVLNATIGAGILGLPSKVYALAGPYSYIAFIAAAFCMLLIMLCFAEISSRFTKSGGPYLMATEAFGSFWGFSIGWLTLTARIMAFATLCNLAFNYAQFLFPGLAAGSRTWFVSGIIVLLTVINYSGIRNATIAIDALTYIKIAVFAVFVAAGCLYIFSADAQPALPFSGTINLSEAIFLLIFAYSGFEATLIPAAEIKNPARAIPFALITGLIIVSILYLLIQAVCMNTLPSLATSEKPLAEASSNFLGIYGAGFLSAGAVISLAGVMHGIILVTSRLMFAMSEQKHLPVFVGKIDSGFRVPHVAIIITAILAFAATVSGGFLFALSVSTGARLLSYLSACIALPVLRKKQGNSPYHLKYGIVIAACAALLSGFLFLQMKRDEFTGLAIAIAAGMVIYFAYYLVKKGDGK